MTPDYSISVNRTAEATERRSATKHTPGPWTAFYSENARQWYIDVASGGQFAIRQTAAVTTPAEMQGNARLIAAAPNMLSALRAIAARVNGVWDDPDLIAFGPLSGCDDDCLSIANKALEKADQR